MPINIPDNLPAVGILANENIFLMPESKAQNQDIRPLRILMLNLMPKKIETETHFLRLLSNSPLQIELDLMRISDHDSKNTSKEHTDNFYRTFNEVKQQKYDGMIITGAPLGLMTFESVSYWPELKAIMDWTQTHVTSTVFVCWAALAAAWHFHGIKKYCRDEKLFGVFEHHIIEPNNPLIRGADDFFWVPHSRNAEISRNDIIANRNLHIIADSKQAGPYLFMSANGRQIYIMGHSEYEPHCLKNEYLRDKQEGLNSKVPQNYFPNDNVQAEPIVRWRSHGHLLFTNWLNYFVYQQTPFKIEQVGDAL
ncbi:MAG: homoserine O-succinyltransferase [Enterobacterales bacterium]|jgi:homoserine O-succinyltransferase